MSVEHKFKMNIQDREDILNLEPVFDYGEFGKITFYRTYSREKPDGSMESWNDVVLRCVEGALTLRKDHYFKAGLYWDKDFWQHYAVGMAHSLFRMEWMPPGRGLWAMGTDFIYERGSMALNNCGYTDITDNIGDDVHWAMDALMCGVGVGFGPIRNDELKVYIPNQSYIHVIPDSREGWCDSVRALCNSYTIKECKKPIFDYSKIRLVGLPIKGFGGLSSGPEPLKVLHEQIEQFFEMFICDDWYDSVLLKTDIMNCIGACVVAGNVRRSAEIACGEIYDKTFLDLKNEKRYAYRSGWSWMSNNSAKLREDEDFELLDEISNRVKEKGEPGIINVKNMKFGRVGRPLDGLREDRAESFNPCGEQPLENKELCTLVETCPTKCADEEVWLKACEYATVYASSVTLLPTHRWETNSVMQRNRRIGVGIVDYTGWCAEKGSHMVTKYLRKGYDRVREVNRWVNSEAGVPESIRVTTMKPGGTGPKVIGRPSGAGHPNFHTEIRRIRVAMNAPISDLLIEAGVPHEPDVKSASTWVFEYPLKTNSKAKCAYDVSLWEQAFNLIILQREWSDNAVSNTLNFKPKWALKKVIEENEVEELVNWTLKTKVNLSKRINVLNDTWKIEFCGPEWPGDTNKVKIFKFDPKHEEDDINSVLAAIAPHIKSASLLPHTEEGVYPQMPESGITEEEYQSRLNSIRPIDWSKLRNSKTTPEMYCTGDLCERASTTK